MIIGYAKLKNNLKIITFFIYGLMLISYVIYIRLILNRLPQDLILLVSNETTVYIETLMLIFLLMQLVFFSIRFYIALKKFLNIPFSSKGRVRQYLLLKLQRLTRITDTAFAVVFSKFIHLFTEDPFESMTPIITKFFNRFGGKLWIFILITQGIKIIILMSFLIDVFIYFKFNYFYQTLSLYIIPLLINAWFFNIDEWQQVARDSANEFKFVVENKNLPNERTIFKNVYKLDDKYFQYCVDIYLKCITFYSLQQKYENSKGYWDTYLDMFYYALYLIGLIYVLTYNLYIIFI